MIYLFGGFNKQQVRYMLQQIALEDPFDVIWGKYSKLKNRDFMTIDTIEGEYKITECNAKEEKEKVDRKVQKKANNQMKGIEEEEVHEDLIESTATNNMSMVVGANPVAREWISPPKQDSIAQPIYRRRHEPVGLLDEYEDDDRVMPLLPSNQPVRDTRKDLSPIRRLERIEPNWEDIWNRNVEGRRPASIWN